MRALDPRLLRHARSTAWYLATCGGVGTATAVLLLVQAGLLADAISRAFIDAAGLGALRGTLLALAAVVVARGILLWVQEVAAQRAAARVKSELRSRVLARVVVLGPAWLTGVRSGQLTTLTTRGLDALDAYFARYLPQLVLAVTVPVLVLARLAGADLVSAAIVAVTLPLIPVFMALVGMATQDSARRRWRSLAVLAHHFADVVAGLPTLQIFGRAKGQAEGVRRVTSAYRRESLGSLRIAFLSGLVLELISTVAMALVAVGVGVRLVDGSMDLGTGLLVLLLAPEAYLPLRQVGTHFHASADGLAAAEEAFAVLEAPLPKAGTDTHVPDLRANALAVRDVTVHYPDRAGPAVDGASFTVVPGELAALTGPSGCGKSTLLAVLLGFVTPDEGRVLVGDVEVSELDPDVWRQSVAWVPQHPYLLPGTVADNVRLGAPDASDVAVRAALRTAGAAGLDSGTRVGEAGNGLSAGQQRRVALARALVRPAPLLLLDEPTAGLDADTEAEVLRGLRGSGRTVLAVAHRPAVLAAVDRVVRLDEQAMAVAS
ncbi:MAG: thiol reductant ABC exporter subunit CydD [Streptosporangiales bacterium]